MQGTVAPPPLLILLAGSLAQRHDKDCNAAGCGRDCDKEGGAGGSSFFRFFSALALLRKDGSRSARLDSRTE